jgi:TRAP-type C4-dicarboxylate transport system permease small subunit
VIALIRKFLKGMDLIVDAIAAVMLCLTFVLVTINVLVRYVFSGSVAWSEEGARYAFVCACSFGLIAVTRRREHFQVPLIIEILPPIPKRICLFISDVMVIGLLYILLHGSISMAILNWYNTSAAIGLPTCIMYFVLGFATLGMLIYTLLHTIEDVIAMPAALKKTMDETKGGY